MAINHHFFLLDTWVKGLLLFYDINDREEMMTASYQNCNSYSNLWPEKNPMV